MLKKLFSFISNRSHKRPNMLTDAFVLKTTHSNQKLSNLETSLLSMLEGKRANDSSVLGWWCSLNNIDRSKTISKLQKNDYLTLADYKFRIRKATIATLKDILQKHELSTRGKKEELIARVIDNIVPYECERCFTESYWALTPKAVDLLHAEEINAQEDYLRNISLIRKGDYEAFKRVLYPNRNQHWGTEDTFSETIEWVMKEGFEGFGLDEEVRRNASSFIAARAVNYNSRGHSSCLDDIFNYFTSANFEISSLKLPDTLMKCINENGIDGDAEIYGIYIGFIINQARSIAELNNYRRLGYKKLRIDSAACQECRRTGKGKIYSIAEVPLLPLSWTCGCIYLL
jgi:hypothetical protein